MKTKRAMLACLMGLALVCTGCHEMILADLTMLIDDLLARIPVL